MLKSYLVVRSSAIVMLNLGVGEPEGIESPVTQCQLSDQESDTCLLNP